jgi:hypothetical protein
LATRTSTATRGSAAQPRRARPQEGLGYLLVGRTEVSTNPMVGITDIGPLSAASFLSDRSGMI